MQNWKPWCNTRRDAKLKILVHVDCSEDPTSKIGWKLENSSRKFFTPWSKQSRFLRNRSSKQPDLTEHKLEPDQTVRCKRHTKMLRVSLPFLFGKERDIIPSLGPARPVERNLGSLEQRWFPQNCEIYPLPKFWTFKNKPKSLKTSRSNNFEIQSLRINS